MPVVHLSRKKFAITDAEAIVMSGDELLDLFGVPDSHDLWVEHPEEDDTSIVTEFDVIPDVAGRRFFTAPKRINAS
jgi:hypothetical protein